MDNKQTAQAPRAATGTAPKQFGAIGPAAIVAALICKAKPAQASPRLAGAKAA